ncbi:sugar transferase [Acidobacteria bacterium AH-259-O06]|nr:sugar transferase [Acidobacteria bacterium AH-259-O06]
MSLALKERKNLLFLVDLGLVNAATALAFWLHAKLSGSAFDAAYIRQQWGLFLLLSILWVVSALVNDLYNLSKTRDFIWGSRSLALTVVLVIVSYMALFFFATPQRTLVRRAVLYQGALGFVLVGTWRVLYAWFTQYRGFSRKAIIVGAGWAGKTIAQTIREHVNPHYQILGFVDDDPEKQRRLVQLADWDPGSFGGAGEKVRALPVLGMGKDLLQLVKEQNVSEVVLAVTHDLHGELVRALFDCQVAGVRVTLMPVLYEKITARVPIRHIGDNWYIALPLDHPGVGAVYPTLKRTFDIVAALIGLGVYAPIFPFLALAVYLDSPGPILHRQARVGKGAKVFYSLKLRTMTLDADKNGKPWTSKRDPRVTRVGRLVRTTRLDEFPQLINILKGDMSAVGPRAWAVQQIKEQKLEEEIPFYRLRNAVRPGMAGWAQVNQDHVDSVEDARIALEYDLYYIKHQSLWLDLLIILKMMGKILALRGR